MVDETYSVYLDYNATTPLEDEVQVSISEALITGWGNPSSQHSPGKNAKYIIDKSRQSVGEMIGAKSQDIIFTSGGTEANNMVLQTAVKHYHRSRLKNNDLSGTPTATNSLPHFITSNLEHDSVKLVLEQMEKEKVAEVTYVAANKETASVDVDDVIAAIRPTTIMITIMMANNETGVIQPIKQISRQVRNRKSNSSDKSSCILIHTDAAQSLGKIDVDVQDLDVDYLTVVGHKFYGPRIGALFVKDLGTGTPLYPIFYGGGQERNYRPGTENTGMIAGLGKASELIVKHLRSYSTHMRDIRDYMEAQLEKTFGKHNLNFNGRCLTNERLPNTCNVSILGRNLQGHKVLSRVRHLQASVGAACHAQNRPSHILLASGVPDDIAANALRLSVGRHTTKHDIDIVVNDLKEAVDSLQCEIKS